MRITIGREGTKPPVRHNLQVNQGSDFIFSFSISQEDEEPFNLDQATVYSTIRGSFAHGDAFSFQVEYENDESGMVTLYLPSTITEQLTKWRYVYDVILVDNQTDITTRIIEGILTVNPGISHRLLEDPSAE